MAQALRDVTRACRDPTPDQLWRRPGPAASVAFHLQHPAGSTDRLFTYARGESLSGTQWDAPPREGLETTPLLHTATLLASVAAVFDRAVDQLRATGEAALLEPRSVGRLALPSNVLGLLMHAAEHASRHAGQVVPTVRLIGHT